jgi:hypothetical protein
LLKDDQLAFLAAEHNVAQFISFGPGPEPEPRHARIRGVTGSFSDATQAIHAILSVSSTCNIRTFSEQSPRGTPFHYQLRQPDEILTLLREYARQGYYTIVNETIDIGDGGVSGVAANGILEFAPQDTPRAVEKPGILSVQRDLGVRILELVYGFSAEIPDGDDQRIEFSIHPLRVGFRHSHTLLWQRDFLPAQEIETSLRWPNRFSRYIGDKAFGLITAFCVGAPVPETIVVSRTIAPFVFGLPTVTGERWIRTCPPEPAAGKFATFKGWSDPFELLRREDPEGGSISSVLSQHAVEAKFAGATYLANGRTRVEGVEGSGEQFMLGLRSPETLPDVIVRDVENLVNLCSSGLGNVRIEWAHDGNMAWLLQIHLEDLSDDWSTLSAGEPSRWLSFSPDDGLEALRKLIQLAHQQGAGIAITRPVGMTSHVGEILRSARIAARFPA